MIAVHGPWYVDDHGVPRLLCCNQMATEADRGIVVTDIALVTCPIQYMGDYADGLTKKPSSVWWPEGSRWHREAEKVWADA